MSKRFSLFVVGFLCLILAPTCMANVQASHNNGYISVNSSLTREVDPNIAEINFAVETQNKSIDVATNDNKKVVNQILTALKAKLDNKNGDVITTGNYNVRPNYSYSKDNKKTLLGYSVVNSIKIKTKDIYNLGKLIDLVIAQGANRVDSLNFSFDNEKSVCNELYPSVVKDLYSQASVIARALNANILGVKSLNANCSVQYNNPILSAAAKSLSDSISYQPTPIEPGKIKIYSYVNADFNIQQ